MMNRLITNKILDIQDARLVAEYHNDALDPAELCMEELYLKKSGGYFLYGRGGIKSQWTAINGEGIKSLSVEDAQKWIKQHANDRNKYADLWGEAEE
ncbi:MAG: hypothetical protein GQ547_00620 [Methylophaga sp.]|nr:hypothetical protein [Methylophaga sp.]